MSDKQVKYHINPKTGRPNKCTATVKGCQFSKDGMVPEHYDTKEEARAAYEKQNKENTFSNTIQKKDTKNDDTVDVEKENEKLIEKSLTTDNSDLAFDYKDISEALNNTIEREGKYIAENDSTGEIQAYKNRLLKSGETFRKVKENIYREYYRLKDSPRATQKELAEEIIQKSTMSKNIIIDNNSILSEYDGNYIDNTNGNVYEAQVTEDNELVFTNQTFQSREDARDDFATGKKPLADDRKLVKEDLDNGNYSNDRYEDEYEDDPKNTYYKTYKYELTEDEIDKLNNQKKLNEISKIIKDLREPTQPEWMILNRQDNYKNEYKDYLNMGDSEDNLLKHYDNALLTRRSTEKEYIVAKNELHRTNQAKQIYESSVSSLKHLKNQYDNQRIPVLKENLKESIEREENNVINKHNNYKKLKENSDKYDVEQLKKNFEDAKAEHVRIEKELNDNVRTSYVDRFAARYPSTDPKECRAAAEKWMKKNSYKFPMFNQEREELVKTIWKTSADMFYDAREK